MVVLILSFTSREFNIMGCSKVDNEITGFYTRIYQPLEFLHIKNVFKCFINLTLKLGIATDKIVFYD